MRVTVLVGKEEAQVSFSITALSCLNLVSTVEFNFTVEFTYSLKPSVVNLKQLRLDKNRVKK